MGVSSQMGEFTIEIDYSLCGNCGACVAVCPENVFHLTAERLLVDNDECIGCNYCIVTCPTGTLTLLRNEIGDE